MVILGKINQVLRNEPYNLDSDLTPTKMMRCKSWYNNLEFRVLIAALDMFWNKFPDSLGVKRRVCTINARFKDLSIISELRRLSQISSKRVKDILHYIFSRIIRDEIMVIERSSEEIDQEDSYFPYMRELRLSKKSLYNNVHLYNWIAICGALLGSKRLFNARIISESGLLVAMNLAIFAEYAFRKYVSATISDQDAEAARVIENLEDGDDRERYY